jgi:predicted RNA binding protein YcfA (HicA-like mRNA interferase family)
MGSIKKIIQQMRRNPRNVKFADICKVCDYYFGEARQKGSHYIYKTPWRGDPRVNIQNDEGKAKTYQVRQVLRAIERLEAERGIGK